MPLVFGSFGYWVNTAESGDKQDEPASFGALTREVYGSVRTLAGSCKDNPPVRASPQESPFSALARHVYAARRSFREEHQSLARRRLRKFGRLHGHLHCLLPDAGAHDDIAQVRLRIGERAKGNAAHAEYRRIGVEENGSVCRQDFAGSVAESVETHRRHHIARTAEDAQ